MAEAGPTGGLVSQHELGQARTKEVHAIKDILGVGLHAGLGFSRHAVSLRVHQKQLRRRCLMQSKNSNPL